MSAVFIHFKSAWTFLGLPCFHEIGDALARLAGCDLIRIRVPPWRTLRLLRWSAPSAGVAIGPLHDAGTAAATSHFLPSGPDFRLA